MPESKYSIVAVGDEELIKKSAGGTGKGQITTWKAYKLKKNQSRPEPWPGGIYDKFIFGVKYRCHCKKKWSQAGTRCPACGVYVFDEDTDKKFYGYYELPVHTVLGTTLKIFREEMKRVIPSYYANVSKEIRSRQGVEKEWNTKIIPYEVDQVEDDEVYVTRKVDGKLCKLVVTPYSINDPVNYFDYYGFEGIWNIINNFNPIKGSFDNLSRYLTKIFIISPISMRPAGRTPGGTIQYPTLSRMYATIIDSVQKLNKYIYNIDENVSLADRIMAGYGISWIINSAIREYDLIKTSKESYLRYALATRIAKSGRANIISADVPIDTIKLPRSLAYEALKTDIMNKIREQYPDYDWDYMYKNPDKEVFKIFEDIANNSVVVINRQPSLHKYSALAFKVSLWNKEDSESVSADDTVTIGMNVQIVGPFNADFDGDQMQFWIATDPALKEDLMKKMGVEHNWIYEKDRSPIFNFNNSLLAGLHFASEPVGDKLENIKVCDDFDDAQSMYHYGLIDYNTPILINEKYTTYGREKLSNILGSPLDEWLRDDDNDTRINIQITGKNISNLVKKLQYEKDKVRIMKDLFDFSREVITLRGSSIAPSGELYGVDTNYPEIDAILKDPNMSEKEKWIKTDQRLPELIKEKLKKEAPKLTESKDAGIKVKDLSLNAILGPSIDFVKGKLIKRDETFLQGLNEDTFVHHIESNRDILNQKASMTPISGYLTRQLVDLCMPIIYKPSKMSNDKIGILTKIKYAEGRYDLKGNRIGKSNSDEKIRIKSSVTSTDPTGFVVCKDELSDVFWDNYNRENAQIGVAFATGFTENITQSSLALKHGGTTFKPNYANLNISEGDAIIKEFTDSYILVEVNGSKRKYPIPKNIVKSKESSQGVVKAKNPIYYLDAPLYIDYQLSRMLTALGAKSGEQGKFDINKTVTKPKHVYALCDGVVKIDFDHKTLSLGKYKYDLYDDEICAVYDGQEVKFGDRLYITGIIDSNDLLDLEDKGLAFYLFLDQMERLNLNISSTESMEFVLKRKFFTGKADIAQATNEADYITAASSQDTARNLADTIDKPLEDSLSLRLILDHGNLTGLGD